MMAEYTGFCNSAAQRVPGDGWQAGAGAKPAQNHLSDLDYARQLVKAGDLEDFELNYENLRTYFRN